MINNIQAKTILSRSKLLINDENIARLTVMINTHCLMVADLTSDQTALKLEAGYRYCALDCVLKALDDAAMRFVEDEVVSLDTSPLSPYINELNSLMVSSELALKDYLLCLRFPLRLTLESQDVNLSIFESNESCRIWSEGFDKLLSNRPDKAVYRFLPMMNFTGNGILAAGRINSGFDALGRRVMDEDGSFHFKSFIDSPRCGGALAQLVLPYILEVGSEWRIRRTDVDTFARFSSGSTSDCGSSMAKKFLALGEEYTSYSEYIGRYSYNGGAGISKVLYVPKNYSEKRTIGELDAVRAYYAQGVRGCIVNSLPKSWGIHLDDQAGSRDRADIGSRYQRYATIDSSKASDRVPWDAFRLIFPQVAEFVSPVRDQVLQLEGAGSRVCYMVSCAGNPITFPCESAFFYALSEGTRRFCNHLMAEKFLKPTVYGDDVIVDDRLAEITISVMSLFNVKVNRRKSYWGNSHYREACGAEYMDGCNCSSVYFPRAFSNNLHKIVSLEHAMYAYPSVRRYLTDLVLTKKPLMTAHIAGTPCTDLWADADLPIMKRLGDIYSNVPEALVDYPIKCYWVYSPRFSNGPDVSSCTSALQHALKGPCVIEHDLPIHGDLTISWIDAIRKSIVSDKDARRDKDGDLIGGAYRLTQD